MANINEYESNNAEELRRVYDIINLNALIY